MEATPGDSKLHRDILRLLASSKVGVKRIELAKRLDGGESGSMKRALDDLFR